MGKRENIPFFSSHEYLKKSLINFTTLHQGINIPETNKSNGTRNCPFGVNYNYMLVANLNVPQRT